MILCVENKPDVEGPAWSSVEKALRRLKSFGRTTFASLDDGTGRYVQVGGGGITCVLEWSDEGKMHRAFSDSPSVATHPEGTTLVFGAGEVAMHKDEWLDIQRVTDVFRWFFDGAVGDAPAVRWRPLDPTTPFVPFD